jgi:hypothetical protein
LGELVEAVGEGRPGIAIALDLGRLHLAAQLAGPIDEFLGALRVLLQKFFDLPVVLLGDRRPRVNCHELGVAGPDPVVSAWLRAGRAASWLLIGLSRGAPEAPA